MTYIFFLVILLMLLGMKRGRKARKRAFDFSRMMGDAIAIRNGSFFKRWVRKQGHKKAGRVINKLKGK